MTQDHPDYNIMEIGQNTEKSPVDLTKLAVTPTPVKEHKLMLAWKPRKEYNNNFREDDWWI